MRTIDTHRTNPANEGLRVEVLDPVGAGGASHHYRIGGFDTTTNPSCPFQGVTSRYTTVLFQNGPIPKNGVNGVTQEALLAIVIDRLQCFQAGPYACRENALALTKLEEALLWLHHRTRARTVRGVEGTHEK